MTNEPATPCAALDFETYYSAECSVQVQGMWGYLRHPEFEAYLLSVACSDGRTWVGKPADFDWASIDGWDWLHHNASFDAAIIEWMQERGELPASARPSNTYDTADLAAYMGSPRSLKAAAKNLLGITVSKDTRIKMKGKRWETMTPGFQAEVSDYAKADARICLQLWQKFEAGWPEHERFLSKATRDMGARGVPIDTEKVSEGIALLARKLWEARRLIPWADDPDAPALSPKALAVECRKHGILPPKSMAKESVELETWLTEHGSRFPWVQAMSDYRRLNMLSEKLKTMQTRTKPDGWMPYGLKYFGAHTGRDSGDSGLNVQNLSRAELFGVSLRECIKAPEGKVFVVCDLSQIEPRCCWPGTLVKTDSGYKCVEDLSRVDKVWDGMNYVAHDGVVFKPGIASTKVNGSWWTEDHRIFLSNSEGQTAGKITSHEADQAWALRDPSWSDIRELVGFVGMETIRLIYEVLRVPLSWLRRCVPCPCRRFIPWKIHTVPQVRKSRDAGHQAHSTIRETF